MEDQETDTESFLYLKNRLLENVIVMLKPLCCHVNIIVHKNTYLTSVLYISSSVKKHADYQTSTLSKTPE